MSKINCWLDCDPGHDDATMILLATVLPQFNVLGFSASYGNSTPSNTLKNLTSVLKILNRFGEIPIFKGAQESLMSDHTDTYIAKEIHGESGLDGTNLLPEPDISKVSSDCNAFLDYFEKTVLKHKNDIVFVSTGPLTSLALIMLHKPHLKKYIKYVTVMGGSFEQTGNRNENRSAEFNIYVDPHAANCCFQDPILKDKILLFPLDITHKALATDEICSRIWDPSKHGSTNSGNPKVRQMFFELLQFFKKTYIQSQTAKFALGPPVHDPLVLIPLFALFGWYDAETDCQLNFKKRELFTVEDDKSKDMGKIYVRKEYKVTKQSKISEGKGVTVFYDMNFDFFWNKIYEAFDILDKEANKKRENE